MVGPPGTGTAGTPGPPPPPPPQPPPGAALCRRRARRGPEPPAPPPPHTRARLAGGGAPTREGRGGYRDPTGDNKGDTPGPPRGGESSGRGRLTHPPPGPPHGDGGHRDPQVTPGWPPRCVTLGEGGGDTGTPAHRLQDPPPPGPSGLSGVAGAQGQDLGGGGGKPGWGGATGPRGLWDLEGGSMEPPPAAGSPPHPHGACHRGMGGPCLPLHPRVWGEPQGLHRGGGTTQEGWGPPQPCPDLPPCIVSSQNKGPSPGILAWCWRGGGAGSWGGGTCQGAGHCCGGRQYVARVCVPPPPPLPAPQSRP